MAQHLRSKLLSEGKTDRIAMLDRLVTDPRMQRVWDEIYKRSRSRPRNYKHPALTNAMKAENLRKAAGKHRKGGRGVEARWAEAEAAEWKARPDNSSRISPEGRQDQAAVRIFVEAVRALDDPPIFVADVRKAADALRKLAEHAERVAKQLAEIGLAVGAKRLQRLAGDLKSEGNLVDPNLSRRTDNYPNLIDRNTEETSLRIFVKNLDYAILEQFGTPLFGTIATLANVALKRTDVYKGQLRLDPHEDVHLKVLARLGFFKLSGQSFAVSMPELIDDVRVRRAILTMARGAQRRARS